MMQLGQPSQRIRAAVGLRRAATALVATAALLLTGCGLFGDDGPLKVVAIGPLHRNPDRAPPPLSLPDRLLLEATAQGLVSFSADGQVEAGLAERWTVIDDGKSYIFRLREARWSNGAPVRAADVVAILRQRIRSPRLRTPLRGEFAAVNAIIARTGKVIEIQLDRPQPALLDLLAQPDMALSSAGLGWGPWRATWAGGTAGMAPVPLMEMVAGGTEDDAADADAAQLMLLWGSNSRNAVTQFDAGQAEVVLGGRFEGWPFVTAAGVQREAISIDPVDGLFGLAVVTDAGLLADGLSRDAVAMAIDRARLTTALNVPGWAARITLRPQRSGNAAIAPIYPAWVDLSRRERIDQGRRIVANWRQGHGDAQARVRIALPEGPGARILFAWLRADLAEIGVEAVLVPLFADADMRLIDELAPSSDEGWYLRRLGCGRGLTCDPEADALIRGIDDAEDSTARAAAIQTAEEAIMRHAGFIPLASPVRWSLFSGRASGLKANVRGRHNLIRLQPSPD